MSRRPTKNEIEKLRRDVISGLSRSQKELPCKYFYDERGSELFERICELPEYYPTRTELAITEASAGEIASLLGRRCLLVEFGSGSSRKTRILLDRLREPAGYVPIDISRRHLLRAAERLERAYPELDVYPLCADYTAGFDLPPVRRPVRRRAVYFPGSTVGNFDPTPAQLFLKGIAALCGHGGGLLIGVDLQKERKILEAAYNDSAGVTAAFNLNLLVRINRELGSDFQLDQFRHEAVWIPECGRIEMHLASLCDQRVRVGDAEFQFEEAETIWTESSYKYTLDGFRELAEHSGFEVRHVWTDPRQLFSLQYLTTS